MAMIFFMRKLYPSNREWGNVNILKADMAWRKQSVR